MDWSTFNEYLLAVDIVSAQEALLDIVVASYPHLKRSDQQSRHKDLVQKAYGLIENDDAPRSAASMAEFAKRLALRG